MRRASILLPLVLLAATPAPTPPPPLFEIHRTAAGAHAEPFRINPLFALVVGSDVREGDPARGRADSLHVVAANTATGGGTIVGIPRDTLFGGRKINATLASGGPRAVVQAVESLSGLSIHYWALIDFSRFRQLVDRLGGVEVDIPSRMADAASGAFFEPGRRHLNGAEALAFARDRHDVPGGDFGRSENQGRLLLAGLARFREAARSPLEVFRHLDAFRDLVESNVPLRDLLALALAARRLDPSRFRNLVLPGRTASVAGASVVILDAAATAGIFSALRDDGLL